MPASLQRTPQQPRVVSKVIIAVVFVAIITQNPATTRHVSFVGLAFPGRTAS
jgi:hypothetical protein